ncbi:hypothetical protein EZV73_07235 [Acidaminobacter sp. JC074]|uniref:hypothetical protein n=1 Tax=Acidaminobacter sp. JC074 TaxID=2530199 RepID=UPI001F0D183E|nr:hypothetical protein [Acidaminobacter sp. JC074]MCH4887358.1 hypothetical protein [Acidaminobacter sp. JC074]
MIILLAAAIIIFLILPLVALMFDKALVKLAIQTITDEIDLQMYQVYQYLDIEELSTKDLILKGDMVSALNQALVLEHPQVKFIDVQSIQLENRLLVMKFELKLNPTLYREIYALDKTYKFDYFMKMPINGE